jgi:hypothetical protein
MLSSHSRFGLHFRDVSQQSTLAWLLCMRATCLESCLPRCYTVCPAVSRSREQAFYWLLRKHRQTSTFFLTVNYFVKPGVSYYWHVTAQYYYQVVELLEGSKCFLPDSYRKFFRCSPPPRSSPIGNQDKLPVQYCNSQPWVKGILTSEANTD